MGAHSSLEPASVPSGAHPEAPRGVYPKKRPCLASGLYSDDTTSTQAARLSESPSTNQGVTPVYSAASTIRVAVPARSGIGGVESFMSLLDLFGGTPLRSLCCLSQRGRYKRCTFAVLAPVVREVFRPRSGTISPTMPTRNAASSQTAPL